MFSITLPELPVPTLSQASLHCPKCRGLVKVQRTRSGARLDCVKCGDVPLTAAELLALVAAASPRIPTPLM